jgi:hypothetical protein
MTAPASSSQAPPPVRTWRPMILWSAGILPALSLAWFVAAVVVPVWQVRSIVTSGEEAEDSAGAYTMMTQDIERLGGKEQAAMRFGFYLRLPDWIAPQKPGAALLLEGCGQAGIPPLAVCLDTRDPDLRQATVQSLRMIALNEQCARNFEATTSAARLLTGTLDSGDRSEVLNVISTLEQLGRAADCARPELEKLLKHPDKEVRDAAAAALAKLRGGEKAK